MNNEQVKTRVNNKVKRIQLVTMCLLTISCVVGWSAVASADGTQDDDPCTALATLTKAALGSASSVSKSQTLRRANTATVPPGHTKAQANQSVSWPNIWGALTTPEFNAVQTCSLLQPAACEKEPKCKDTGMCRLAAVLKAAPADWSPGDCEGKLGIEPITVTVAAVVGILAGLSGYRSE